MGRSAATRWFLSLFLSSVLSSIHRSASVAAAWIRRNRLFHPERLLAVLLLGPVALGQLSAAAEAANPVILQESFEGDLSAWQVTAESPNRAALQHFLFEESFEGDLSQWQVASTSGGTISVSAARPYIGSSSLDMNYSVPSGYLHLTRSFAPATNLRARVYFYDAMAARLGSVFLLRRDAGPNAPNTGLGVKTDVSGSSYVIRIDSVGNTRDTGIARSLGWHLFELLVTPIGTYARIDDRPVSVSNPNQTSASVVDFVSTWTLTGQAYYDALTIESGYQSAKALLLDYQDGSNGRAVIVSRTFSSATNLMARTFFYDTMDSSLGSVFQLRDSAGTRGTALGVVTSLFPNTYAIRINSFSGTQSARVPRSAGWHLFELIVTPTGTYAKIDNQLVVDDQFTPISNPYQTTAGTVDFVSTWNLTGQAVYDDLTIVAADPQPWQEQLYTPMAVHYQTYSASVPGGRVFSPLYPALGAGLHSNDLRSVFATATAWYLYGKHARDSSAISLAKQVFLDGLANGPWNRGQDVNDWARGASMRVFAHAAHLMWAELDQPTRDWVLQVLYDQANSYLNRLPESGYVGDTKAEENAWHAAFLAAVVNLFPNVPNKEILEAKARCFAYHSITTSMDPPYCGLTTQTVYDDFTLQNHNRVSPIYMAGVLHLLGEGGLDYRRIGKPIPWEFSHNVPPLYDKFSSYLDLNTFHFRQAPPDWSGAHDTAYIVPGVLRYLEELGIPLGFSRQDFASKRSLFYHQIVSEWTKKLPPAIRIQDWNQLDPASDAYKWFLDSVDAGEFYMPAVVPLPALCDESLYKEKIWAGFLNWSCDTAITVQGGSSVRLNANAPSTAEAYSPLIPVRPGATYQVSYYVKTDDLTVQDARAFGKVVVAQYGSSAREDEPVNASSRIDAGLFLGENVGGTTDWVLKSYRFTTTASTAYVRLRGLLGGLGTAKGTVWLDKVELVPVSSLAVSSVDASSFDPSTPPGNTRDGNLDTRWSAQGDGQWILYDLGAVRTVAYVTIAWYRGAFRTARFDVQTSLDGSSWRQVYSGQTSGMTAQRESFDLPDTAARYMRIIGHGNSENNWNSLTEVEIYGW